MRFQFFEELLDFDFRAFNFNQQVAGLIADEPAEIQSRGQAVDERTKADALDNSFDRDAATLDGGSGYLAWYSINFVVLAKEAKIGANISAGAALKGDYGRILPTDG